uniref:Uncharacterized protein n=1 Tax=Neovison vison TaxID=452646 RepID=A0A8C7AMR1_NEOVI
MGRGVHIPTPGDTGGRKSRWKLPPKEKMMGSLQTCIRPFCNHKKSCSIKMGQVCNTNTRLYLILHDFLEEYFKPTVSQICDLSSM